MHSLGAWCPAKGAGGSQVAAGIRLANESGLSHLVFNNSRFDKENLGPQR